MTQHDPLVTLHQIIDSCDAATEILGDHDAVGVASSMILSLALTRALEITGEAARRLPESFRESYPDVPWRSMINFRNVLAHGFDVIDYGIAVETVRNDLPPLVARLREVLSELERGQRRSSTE